MADTATVGAGLLTPQAEAALRNFVLQAGSSAEQTSAIEAGLQSPLGQSLRDAMARWIVDEIVPVEKLVPAAYIKWRPPVHDAMKFVVARLSPARLAPKLLEQVKLPANTSAEARLLRLIAKVPGLQKLGQVLARNQHLRPALRKELARLENGIRDVQPGEIRAIIDSDLKSKLETFSVEIAPNLLSEASISAVMRFTWRNPDTGRRERGVFKVLKPYIPDYFAEDMDYLQALAKYFGDRHHSYGFPPHLIPDTFQKVRRLLRHEVNFVREQKTLLEAWTLYRDFPGVRVPRLIQPLCTSRITAMSEERGLKVTSAAAHLPVSRRRKVAEQLAEALVGLPLFAAAEKVIFHGDPHAGNLLYNTRTGELTILDWALYERLGREQRRHLALMFLMLTLRDPLGICKEVVTLSQDRIPLSSPRGRVLRETVDRFLDDMPASRLPSAADAMRLLENIAMKGIKFPGPLVMLRKVMFTLEGILADIVGSGRQMGFTVAPRLAQHWLANRTAFRSPLKMQDWLTLHASALLYSSRVWLRWKRRVDAALRS